MTNHLDLDSMSNEDLDRLTVELDQRGRLLPLIDLTGWLHGDPPPRQFLWGELLPIHQTTMLTGEGGVGKSLLAQMLCTCSALGLPFLGMATRQRPALYLTAEDDHDELWRRQSAICRQLGVGIENLVGKLDMVSLCGDPDTALATFDANGTMTVTDRWREVEATIRAKEVGLAAFDNATDLMAGDHNALDQVAAFVRLLTGSAIESNGVSLILHHPNKANDDWLGSVAWHNKVRSRLIMRYGDPEGDRDIRLIENPKANYSASGASFRFRWFKGAYVRDEDLPPSLAERLATTATASADNAMFLACLDERNRQQRPVSESPASRTYAPKVFADMPEAKRIGDARLKAAMDRLFRIGAIERGFIYRDTAEGKDRVGLRRVSVDPAADLPPTVSADLPLTTRRPPPAHTPPPKGGVGARPAGAAAPLTEVDREKALDLRIKIAAHFLKFRPAKQKSWAEAHGVTRDDLRQYINGDPYHLPAPKVAELIASIKNEERAERAERDRA